MRFPLRWRILLFTVLTPLALTAATLWTVDRAFTQQVRTVTREDLQRASLVFERVFEARASRLDVAAAVIARDPRFYSVLAISGSSRDPGYRGTVSRVARDFNVITHADLFEVVDSRGCRLASVGRSTSGTAARRAVLGEVLHGQGRSGILVDGNRHFQVAVLAVRMGPRIVGALLLGSEIAQPLAHELRTLTNSEVTFVSNGAVTGSSRGDGSGPATTLAALARQPGFSPTGAGAGASRGGNAHRAIAIGGTYELHEGSRTYLTLVRAIPGSATPGGQLYVMQRSLDEQASVLRDVQARLLRLGLLAALVAIIAGILVAEHITRPVRRLVRGAEQMARGDYDYPLGRPGSDEIGFLSERFTEMRHHERAYVSGLRQAARVRSEFITLASHELRTPISVIRAYHELFTSEALGPVTAAQGNALEAIDRSVCGLVQLAEAASCMAQLEEGRPVLDVGLHDLAALLEPATASVLGEARGRKVELTLHVAPEIGAVPVDGPRLAEAVTNLVRNGIRFTPDGGHVDVVARREDAELVVEVTDDGIGIPAEQQADLFERPFLVRGASHHHSSSTHEFNSGGLGLGLPIAHGLVLAHGGTLRVRSVPGQGSTFTIRIPCADGRLEAAA